MSGEKANKIHVVPFKNKLKLTRPPRMCIEPKLLSDKSTLTLRAQFDQLYAKRFKNEPQPWRSVSKIDEEVFNCTCDDACVKHEDGKEMLVKGTVPSTHKNTLRVAT